MAVDVQRVRMVLAGVVSPIHRPGVHVAPIGVFLQLGATRTAAEELADRQSSAAGWTGHHSRALVGQIGTDAPSRQRVGYSLVFQDRQRGINARHLVLGRESE